MEPGTQTLQPTPTITGTPRPDSAVTGVPGTWDTGTTRTYQWSLDDVARERRHHDQLHADGQPRSARR